MALKPTLGLHSFVIEWRRTPPLHETVELGSATGAGIAAAYVANQCGKTQTPTKNETGLDASHHTQVSAEGAEKNFLLTSSFIG